MRSASVRAGARRCRAGRGAHCCRLPAGSVLEARKQVVIYTGYGRSDGVSFFMNSGRAVWNNDGDTATLYDATGTPVLTFRYE